MGLLLAACAPRVIEKPVMAPVETPRVPKEAATPCGGVDWPPITLPTTAAEQVAGRHADRAMADAALAECDGRRASGVRALRRR
ncbi:hypothetical protein [Inquilinus sp.]|uniref:hypothetical protein n=1 Tax=Inquilinus sp. TaxID=1932117 RepID=UPI0031DECC9A